MIREFLESDYVYWSDMEKEERKVVFSFGGGVDSTGMLFEFDRQGYMPDLIIFADTGGERPDIYEHIKKLNKWLSSKWYREIIIVRNKETLYDECIRRETLPALAMGFHTCSQKHKIRPIAKYLKANGYRKIIKILGFDAMEFDRARRGLTSIENNKNTEENGIDLKVWFPLIEWNKTRKDLQKEINDVGFCASKSSCFFCPAMSRGEVRQLEQHYPELLEKALIMEDQAKLDKTKGLGRSWNWREELNQLEFWSVDEMKDNPQVCGCLNW